MLRKLGSILLGIIALLLGVAIWVTGETRLSRQSLDASQSILSAFKQSAIHTEEYRARTGRIPDTAFLLKAIEGEAFDYQPWPSNSDENTIAPLWVAQPGEACDYPDRPSLSKDALTYYRLCYWRGEWTEQYVPQTGEHTLSTSIDEYSAPIWLRILIGVSALISIVIAVRIWPRYGMQTEG